MRFIKQASSRVRAALVAVYLFAAAVTLGACQPQTKTVYVDKPVPYAVPVATGCIDPKGRPAVPTSLRGTITPEAWAAMPPGAKASAVQAQAGRRLSYEELDRAATSGCAVRSGVDKVAAKP